MRTAITYVTIPLSGTVSDQIQIPNTEKAVLWCPTVTSCQVLLQGSFDTTSANFVRVQNAAGSGQWTFSAGVGSNCISLKDAGHFPYARLEATIAQAAVRSFAIITQF